MRVFARQSRAYRRGMAALLSALLGGDALAVRYHMQRQARVDAADGASRAPRTLSTVQLPPPTPGPAARLVGGAPTQGGFTLATLTRAGAQAARPPGTAGQPGGLMFFPPGGDGTGLWIKRAGGIGVITFPAPTAPGRTIRVFGGADLVITCLPSTAPPPPPPTLLQRILQFLTHQRPYTATSHDLATSFQWCQTDGVTPLPSSQQPYDTTLTAGVTSRPGFVLIPRMDRQITLTAQSLTAKGAALGPPVTLHCNAVSADTFFAFLPSGYSAQTARFSLTAAPAGGPPQARWFVASLPHSLPGLSPPFFAHTGQTFGALVVRAAAVETPDDSGATYGSEQPPPPARTRGAWALSPPQNVDDHPWTGVPTIRCVVQARSTKPSLDWQVNIRRLTPEWEPAPLPNATQARAAGTPIVSSLSVGRVTVDDLTIPGTASLGWSQSDLACGIAYPGQQRWIRVDAEAVRHVTTTETLTFHNALVRRAPISGRWEVVFQKPQTLTTPSGITLTTLNRRPGIAPPLVGHQPWNWDASAELLLAWRLPHGIGAQPSPTAQTPQAFPPDVMMPQLTSIPLYLAESAPEAVPDWRDAWVPGAPAPVLRRNSFGALRQPLLSATPLAPLLRHGYQVVRLWVCDPRLLRAGGATAYSPSQTQARLLPTTLPTLTVSIQVQRLAERHPLHFVIPVRTQFPAGWNPDALDNSYQSLY